jgi:putative Holliday junction resolvase
MGQTSGAPGAVLGLDLGEARIGLALSDPDRRVALPLGTLKVGQPPGELKGIASVVAERDVSLVVVGHPRSMSGRVGKRALQAESFADALRSILKVPVELQDERLTTVEAERHLRDAGVRGPGRKARVDAAAAAVLLQAWLDAHRRA